MRKKLLYIVGQTATGKTELAVGLAKQLRGAIINADSRQVYKEMNIGTGKDLPEHRKLIQKPFPHYCGGGITYWLFDSVSVDHDWSLAHFLDAAYPVIEYLWKKDTLPIVVGGAGFFVDALEHPPETVQVSPNPSLRKQLGALSAEQLQERLKQVNAARLDQMNPSDKQNARRLIRAIEIEQWKQDQQCIRHSRAIHPVASLWIGLRLPPEQLRLRIYARVIKRLNQGMIAEVNNLIQQHPHWNSSAFTATGYTEVRAFIEGAITKDQMIERWVTNELNYAKRQRTWFIRNTKIRWFDPTTTETKQEVERLAQTWYDSNGA